MWVPKMWSWALTRHNALASCEPMCRSVCTGCSCRWRAWLCVRDTRRTSRSSCCATRSQSCADRTIVQLSPMRTGRCWVPSLRPRADGCEPVGSPHQSHRATAANCPNDTLPRPHQRIPNSCLTSHDTISGTHRPQLGGSQPLTAYWGPVLPLLLRSYPYIHELDHKHL